MSNQLPQKDTRDIVTGKPLQRQTWVEKIRNNKQWFKDNVDYYLNNSIFYNGSNTTTSSKRDLGVLYNVYNNQFPLEWFKHITDPLNAKKPEHRRYPAKIRPTSMLRTNIDLLLGEYPKRPFVYQVVNMGEDAYNSYTESLNKAVQSNIEEHFLAVAQAEMKNAGYNINEIPQPEEIELPESIKQRFTSSYKDNLAIRGQRWMKRAIREYNVKQKLLKMFKDWLIAGQSYSYKNIVHGNLVYERVSPKDIDFDKSPDEDFIEDGQWVVRRRYLTLSDVVDEFYDELTEEDHTDLETRMQWNTPDGLYAYLNDATSANNVKGIVGKIPVYHCVWKGRKKIVYATYTDPLTGQTQELQLDEDTPIDDTMTKVKEEWVNEVYEGTRIGDNIYCRLRAIPVQRNEMNNISRCKLPYNGRKYSDTHSQNISVLEMGIPYAIMYMICDFTLEKTIAKNKGKITLFDINAIPKNEGWDEEKFFYYADALGYMLLNRNQLGVDKSWNQYTTLDMTLFQQIKELITIRDSFVQAWDNLLGINPQRKAQVDTSAGLGTTQEALFRSSVITDMIFTLFEEFCERELQGLLDYSKFVNVDGIRGIYNADDFDRELLDIDPNSYCNAELGLFIRFSAEELQILQQYKAQTQAMIQNGVKQSTILEIQRSNNIEELMGKLKRIEEIEMEQAQAAAEDEHAKAMEIEQIKERYLKLQSMLKIEEINAEWDRRDENEMIKGEYSLFSFGGDGDNNNNGIPDAAEICKRVIAQQKIMSDERRQSAELKAKMKIHEDQMKLEDKKLQSAAEDRKSKEKIARMKPKPKSK